MTTKIPYWYTRYISKEDKIYIETELRKRNISFSKFLKIIINQIKIGDNLNNINLKIFKILNRDD